MALTTKNRRQSGGMRRSSAAVRAHWGLLAPVMMALPLLLGAKGCDSAVVGDMCPDGSLSAECAAGAAGAGSEPEQLCGGLRGLACDPGEFCSYSLRARCGAADQTGVCAPVPEVCADIYQPVCGCDDRTYANECEANSQGVSVASSGRCPDPMNPDPMNPDPMNPDPMNPDPMNPDPMNPDPMDPGPPEPGSFCGGLMGVSCSPEQYCKYEPDALCGAADAGGVCTTKPMACDAIYLPVCGCDGKTYGNDCEAAIAGVSVMSKGECENPTEPEPQACGGLRGLQCARDEYCNYPPDANCGRADATGVCTPRAEICTQDEDPVCGCDGVTYSNDCVAASAGVSVEHAGPCRTMPTGKICGGMLGLQCGEGEYCEFLPEAHCGAADQTGTCSPIPNGCTKEFVPVCGCDDQTYSNRCMAAASGVSVAILGECRQ